MVKQMKIGLNDVIKGFLMWRLWLRLGWIDIVRRYRRTMIGPFWGTLSIAAFIGTMGFLYAGIFNQELTTYLPYLASGFAVWIPIAGFVAESSGTFIAAEGVVKQSKVPLTMFVCQAAVRNAIVYVHNIQVYVFVAIVFSVQVNINFLLILPAILLLFANSIWVGILVSLLCTRFRDLQQLIATILQMLFFLTPIFWTPGQAGRVKTVFVDMNPMFHFVDILRSPMLGKAPAMLSWYFVAGITVVGWLLTLIIFSRYRQRVVLWM
jgi:ABC-type polysaccharide/polyol phosphate export permease